MNLKELQIIKHNILARTANKVVAPLFLSGKPGTGKSSTVRAIAAEMGYALVEYSCPAITIEKLSGLPTESPTPDFNKAAVLPISADVNSTIWSIPEIVADVWNSSKSGSVILLLDDFHALPPHLQAYFYTLLLEYRLGNYKLPDNCVILGTMNDSQEAGMQGFLSAIRNRISILTVEWNFEHWFTQNGGNQLHYLVASFLKAKPHYCQESESTGIEGFASARAWTSISAELSAYSNPNSFAHQIARMQVSTQAAQAFQAHVAYIEAIDFTKLVANRTLVDLSKQDPLDSIIYSYITNFIHTLDDAMYLFELLAINHSNAASAFVGFVIGELYIKQRNIDTISEGLKFVIKKLTNQPMIASDYPNTSKAKFDKLSVEPIQHIHEYMKIASQYLL